MQTLLQTLRSNTSINFNLTASLDSTLETKRLFHGRGKLIEGLEHLNIDQFDKYILITTYKEITDEEKNELKSFILGFNAPLSSVLLQKRYGKNLEVEVLYGEIPEKAVAVENNLKFAINLAKPQNIGFFLDMKPGRNYLIENSKDKKVLNLFSYTCSLSVAALKGGAKEVVNVDMSQAALNVGKLNQKINGFEDSKVRYLDFDIMKSLGTLGKRGPYDLIIIDPPSNQGDSFKVEKDYPKILKRLPEMMSENCIVMACLNAPYFNSDYLLNMINEYCPNLKLVNKEYSAFSPMESDKEAGLKILFLMN